MQTYVMVDGRRWATARSKGRWSDLWTRIVGKTRSSELIEMCAQRYGYQPQRFRWHGALMRIGRIEQVWEHVGRGTQCSRRYFRVICQNNQIYTLYQDLQLGAWYVEC